MNEKWRFLDDVSAGLSTSGGYDLGQGMPTILADELIAALSREDRAGLDVAQVALERFYFEQLNRMPHAAVVAARGEDDGTSSEAAAFSLGQLGFAHAVMARAGSKRVDDAFERRIRSGRYERYIRLLLDEELSGKDIAARLKKDEAIVSRMLKVLRQIGAVECRREGTRVVNFLTPAARAVAAAHNMGSLAVGASSTRLPTEVAHALEDRRQQLPEELRHAMVLVVTGDRKGAR